MLIFGNNTPIKQKQWINTKVEFEWSKELQKYVEITSDGYWYDGDMALCGTLGATTFTDDIKQMKADDIEKSIAYENEIDDMRNKLIDLSSVRLSQDSNSKSELIFIDIVKHLEHIGDYSMNISQAL